MRGEKIGEGNTAEIFAWGPDKILKLYHEGTAPGLCEKEFACVQAVAGIIDTLPKAHELVEVEGRTGAVYDRVQGGTLLDEMLARPWQVVALSRELAAQHAAMHKPAGGAPLPGVKGRIEGFIAKARLPAVDRAGLMARLQSLPPYRLYPRAGGRMDAPAAGQPPW